MAMVKTIEAMSMLLPSINGAKIATANCGSKYKQRDDLLFIVFEPGTKVAGVFTKSLCPSAPVDHCRAILPFGRARALVVNAGNANAFTGHKGAQATEAIARHVAELTESRIEEIFLASTGVIGECLIAEPIMAGISHAKFSDSPEQWQEAAKAIMTTDTYAKYATRSLKIDGANITLNAIAKGSGMIAPNMATMLCFIATDADIDSDILQSMLESAVDKSFNSITVDGDTSTSDTVLCFATGQAGGKITSAETSNAQHFQKALNDILHELALAIVKDGEGATHLIQVEVAGAVSDSSAKKIALAVANSPLVKTAIAGGDANWGRVVMAVGKAGEPADRDRLSIYFGPHMVAMAGSVYAKYNEAAASLYMRNYQIDIIIDIGLGHGSATIWTCDLTAQYVAINADYRS